MRAIQHKCLPHLTCINPMPLLFLKNLTNSKMIPKIWKKIHISRVKSIDIQYISLRSIFKPLFVWIFFGFWTKFRKLIWNLKKSFSSICRASWDESTDKGYNTVQFDRYSRHAILLNLFCFFLPKFRKLIRNLEKKLFISLCSSLRRIHWYSTHCNLFNIHDSLFFWIFFGFHPKFTVFNKNFKNLFEIWKKLSIIL